MSTEAGQVEVHLYGKLRRVAGCSNPTSDCVRRVPVREGEAISDVLTRLGIGLSEISNMFLNGELSAATRAVRSGDRLGVFPDDMATLYKWYFARKG